MRGLIPYIIILAAALLLPFFANDYWAVIGARAAVYWVLVAGLNLVVGYGGQLAIGWVALLTLGSYTAAILVARFDLNPFLAYAAGGGIGAIAGVVVGLPALRLRTFYFAMTTLGFATIVTQVALSWQSVTGGGIGLSGPSLNPPFDSPWGFYLLTLGFAAVVTWMTANVASSRWGRSLVAIRDAEVAAEATGISKARLLTIVFLFSGFTAGLAGGLFGTLQSYITPDAFTFDLSVTFFIAILVGGRGSILGPLLGNVLLTLLPEFAAPLVAWSTFLYAALLLAIVLLMPGGIAALLDFRNRKPLESHRTIVPRAERVAALLGEGAAREDILLRNVILAFGGVRAIDGLTMTIKAGQVHGLIGPNGSGKTTTLNVISGFYEPQDGEAFLGTRVLPHGKPQTRAAMGIARTFQTPRVIGEASVLQNVMIGASIDGHASFMEAALTLPRHRSDEKRLSARAIDALAIVGLEALAEVRADRLQHSELRFVEIARALCGRPAFLLLDEPAAGLSTDEITRLGGLIKAVAAAGTGVLLVEHHADLIFDICDQVTVLNLGKELAGGTPSEIRSHKEVVSAYLGA
jgi:branched-chain amino acid transport system permease protein